MIGVIALVRCCRWFWWTVCWQQRIICLNRRVRDIGIHNGAPVSIQCSVGLKWCYARGCAIATIDLISTTEIMYRVFVMRRSQCGDTILYLIRKGIIVFVGTSCRARCSSWPLSKHAKNLVAFTRIRKALSLNSRSPTIVEISYVDILGWITEKVSTSRVEVYLALQEVQCTSWPP